jgi:hypothetical protein
MMGENEEYKPFFFNKAVKHVESNWRCMYVEM